MIDSVQWPSLHRFVVLGGLIAILFLIAGCSPTPRTISSLPPELQLPDPVNAIGPVIPFQQPNILGDPQLTIEPFTEIADIEACLALGQSVYGIALQNTNVRTAPTLDACRVGRIPRGTLVEVTSLVTQIVPSAGIVAQREELSEIREPTITRAPRVVALGYEEDIQPIFERNCIACHSSVVKQMNLQVTSYEGLMAGSSSGPVVLPGNVADSLLWQQVSTGKMPLIGELTLSEKEAVRRWIADGALERRPPAPIESNLQAIAKNEVAAALAGLGVNPFDNSAEFGPSANPSNAVEGDTVFWLNVAEENIDPVPDLCEASADDIQQVVSAELILPVSCGLPPRNAQVQSLLQSLAIVPAASRSAGSASIASSAIDVPATNVQPATNPAPVAPRSATVPQAGIQAAAFGLPAPAESDGWLTARGGFCVDPHFTQNDRSITALEFAPDGRLFVALDSRIDGEPDPNILYDAYHPSRSIVVYDPNTRYTPNEIMRESSRITGMAYANGALFLNRAGEVGWIPDGDRYRTLAGGFAVNSQLFHANNGMAIHNGYLYVSAGGVRDGYSDGPIVGMGEAGAQNVVSGGNRFAARLVRAPLDRLINEYNIELFETAARGLRNPYGVTVDPTGRLWFTDNGATNVPEDVSAGDEVNVYLPASSPPGTPEDSTPYYGFPLALTTPQPWYTGPVVDLVNTSAPTGITWAHGTIFFGQYGRDPGLYRLGRADDGQVIAERVMLVWPLLALTTAPDGALWIGTGSGGLYRMVPGC